MIRVNLGALTTALFESVGAELTVWKVVIENYSSRV